MALFRALETVQPPGRRLFDDPLAVRFLRPRLRWVVRAARLGPVGRLVRTWIDHRWPGVRTSGAARTRFIDDVLESRLAAGLRQVVILGAGFDARAYRLAPLSGATVFEVDHPDTSAAKRRAVTSSLGAAPARVRFMPVDLNREALDAAMAAAGYDAARPTLFVWEGVTNYLTEAAVSDTLRWCARAAPGSQVLFTYIDRMVLEAPQSFAGTERIQAALSAAHERWTFGLHPAELAAFLAARGLALQSDVGAAEYRARYYGPAAEAMRGYEFYRIALASVGPPAAAGRAQ
jgi:methyltransferase (TIGR00027 family)